MLVTLVVFTFRSLQPDPYRHQSFISFPTQVFLCAMYYVCLAHSYLKSWTWLRYLAKTPTGFSTSYRGNWAIIKIFYTSRPSWRRCILDIFIFIKLDLIEDFPFSFESQGSAHKLELGTFGKPNCLIICPNHVCMFKLIILYKVKTRSPLGVQTLCLY